jgi:glycosyltransferase involved in cell wall biosynthesis
VRPRALFVGHVPPDARGGGVGNHMGEAARAVSDLFEISWFTRGSDGSGDDLAVSEETLFEGGRAFVFAHRGVRGTSFRERTRFEPAEAAFDRVLRSVRPDVVHIHHWSWLSSGMAAAARAFGARVVLTLHDHVATCPRGRRYRPDDVVCETVVPETCAACVVPRWIEAVRNPDSKARAIVRALFGRSEDLRLLAERERRILDMLASADAIVFPSEDARRRCAERFGSLSDRMRVIPPVWKRPLSAPPRRPDGAVFRVGLLGDPAFAKGIVPAARAIAGCERPTSLDVWGEPSAHVAGVLSAAAPGHVRWRGRYTPDTLGDVMATLDAVVVPSLWPETFGIVAREAAAYGRPVIVSAIGGLADAVVRGVAVGVPPGDVHALRAAIDALPSGSDPIAVPSGVDAEWCEGRDGLRALYADLVVGGKTGA